MAKSYILTDTYNFINEEDNKLTIAGLEKLIFKQWPNLISINLNNKIISEVGIILVARELNCSIKHSGHYWNNFIYVVHIYNLADCKLGNEGTKHLSKSRW